MNRLRYIVFRGGAHADIPAIVFNDLRSLSSRTKVATVVATLGGCVYFAMNIGTVSALRSSVKSVSEKAFTQS